MDAKSRAMRAEKNPITVDNLDNFSKLNGNDVLNIPTKYAAYLDSNDGITETYSEKQQKPRLSSHSPKQSVATEKIQRDGSNSPKRSKERDSPYNYKNLNTNKYVTIYKD